MNFSKKSLYFNLSCLWFCSCCVITLAGKFILTPDFFAANNQSLSSNAAQNISLYDGMQRWSYLYQGIYCLFKVTLISCILHTGMFISGYQAKFRNILTIALLSEYIFISEALIKVCWFYYWYPHGNLMDWHRIYLLSAASLFQQLPANWIYPLSMLNLFELTYWFVLAYGLSKVSDLTMYRGLKIIMFSYLPALVVWVICVCFCSVMLFPSHN